MSATAESTQVYRVFIKASAEQIWQAIVDPELTVQYFHGVRIAITADERRSSWGSDEVGNGSRVLEFDPPRRLVHEWLSYYDPEMAQEPISRVTWEIEPQEEGGYCLLTLVHDRLEGSPKTAGSVGGRGWMFVLSGLKTLVETGKGLA